MRRAMVGLVFLGVACGWTDGRRGALATLAVDDASACKCWSLLPAEIDDPATPLLAYVPAGCQLPSLATDGFPSVPACPSGTAVPEARETARLP